MSLKIGAWWIFCYLSDGRRNYVLKEKGYVAVGEYFAGRTV